MAESPLMEKRATDSLNDIPMNRSIDKADDTIPAVYAVVFFVLLLWEHTGKIMYAQTINIRLFYGLQLRSGSWWVSEILYGLRMAAKTFGLKLMLGLKTTTFTKPSD